MNEQPTSGSGQMRRWVWYLLSALLAYGAFRLLGNYVDPLPSALFSAVILLALLSRKWWAMAYTAAAGIAYGVLAFFTSLTGLLPVVAALLWPLTICGVVATSYLGDDYLPEGLIPSSPAVVVTEPAPSSSPPDAAEELPGSPPAAVDDTAVSPDAPADEPAVTPPAEVGGLGRLRVIGNSYVRAGPGTDFDVVTTVPDGIEFEVIELSVDLNWYLIELENGQRVWIGSSRIEKLAP